MKRPFRRAVRQLKSAIPGYQPRRKRLTAWNVVQQSLAKQHRERMRRYRRWSR